jgi:hypothetical protein
LHTNAKLTGPIPASLTNLTKVATNVFRLYGNPGLCHLNADSTGVTARCDQTPAANQCPYPACGCKWAPSAVCVSGRTLSATAFSDNTDNPISPFYPDDATCCEETPTPTPTPTATPTAT